MAITITARAAWLTVLCIAACQHTAHVPIRSQVGSDPDAQTNPTAFPAKITDPAAVDLLASVDINPEHIHCNNESLWVPGLKRYVEALSLDIAKAWSTSPPAPIIKETERKLLAHIVRLFHQNLEPHNFGVMKLSGRTYRDKQGKSQPLLIYRTAFIVDADQPDSCLSTLLRDGGVRHVVNLYDGIIPVTDWVAAERRATRNYGASYYSADASSASWINLIRSEEPYSEYRDEVMRRVAMVIREQILFPEQKRPRGNVVVHCAGGMHRSGIVIGILRRCVNAEPFDQIEAEYRGHTGYLSDRDPRGYDPLNLRFIKDFDCQLLQNARRQTELR